MIVSRATEQPVGGCARFCCALIARQPARRRRPTRTVTSPRSGSTPAAPPVTPKGTVHTQANLYWTAELYGKGVLGLREGDVVFSAAKLFFAYGLGNALSFPLSVGASVVLMAERPTPQACFKRFTELKANGVLRRTHRLRRDARQPRPAEEKRLWHSACAHRPVKRCRKTSANAGPTISAWKSSTASAPPRCCMCSSPTARATCATAPPASRCRVTKSSCAAKTASPCPMARSATSTSKDRAPH